MYSVLDTALVVRGESGEDKRTRSNVGAQHTEQESRTGWLGQDINIERWQVGEEQKMEQELTGWQGWLCIPSRILSSLLHRKLDLNCSPSLDLE